MSKTKISWTEQVWNPLAGCSIVSSGCTHCYAMRMAHRLEAMGQAKYAGLTKVVNGNAVWTGKVNLDEKALEEPLRRKKPTMYFVNSMSDLFHESVHRDFILRVFMVMRAASQHTFQVLTKRTERMATLLNEWMPAAEALADGTLQQKQFPLPNVWLGVSVENQATASERIPLLLQTPAAVRFISAEPLLESIYLHDTWSHDHPYAAPDAPGIDWVICGGESGPDARPMHPDWARGLRDQCANARVPFFFKQWGEWLPETQVADATTLAGVDADVVSNSERHLWSDKPNDFSYFLGKKHAGNLLDGKVWKEYPEVVKA